MNLVEEVQVRTVKVLFRLHLLSPASIRPPITGLNAVIILMLALATSRPRSRPPHRLIALVAARVFIMVTHALLVAPSRRSERCSPPSAPPKRNAAIARIPVLYSVIGVATAPCAPFVKRNTNLNVMERERSERERYSSLPYRGFPP